MHFFVKFELLLFKNIVVSKMKKLFPTLDQISRKEKGKTLKAITCNSTTKKSNKGDSSMNCFNYNLQFNPI
jgi:hypothetical protein